MDKYFALMHWLPLNMIEINLFKKIFKTEYQFIIGAINQTQDFDLITTFNCGLFYIWNNKQTIMNEYVNTIYIEWVEHFKTVPGRLLSLLLL